MTAIFSEAEADRWRDDLVAHAPSLENVSASGQMEIAGVALRADSAGVLYRLRSRDGRELTFRMNAVAARIMAAATIGEAQAAGWIDERGDLAPAQWP